MTRKIEVPLPGRSYAVCVGSGLLGESGGALLQPIVHERACVVVTDDRVAELYLDAATTTLERAGAARVESVGFPAGEASKTLATVAGFYAESVRFGLDRSGLVVALGGGVAGDLAGFLAATYMRGVDLVQLPTSLLAMVDSSVGGKTGVDLPEGKNLVGAFKQPRLVLAELDALRTLPARELRAGLAEVVKYGVALDAELLAFLEANVAGLLALDTGLYERVVARCCELKTEVVLADEEDLTGRRAVLNYGHSFGHALETLGGYSALLHGEAVAIGMMMAAELAAAREPGLRALIDRQQALWQALGLPIRAEGFAPRDVLDAMRADKKVERGELRLVLPRAVGDCGLVGGVEEREVLGAIEARCVD